MENNNEIAYFKIHPAIGVAHLGTCEESVEFFDQLTKFQQACGDSDAEMKVYQSFKTEDNFKKQTVQFSVHAYDKNGNRIDDANIADINIQWDIKLSNRKLHNYSKKSQHKFYIPEVKGERLNVDSGTLTGIKEFKKDTAERKANQIFGRNPWDSTLWIDLGDFSEGLFTPPISKLYNRKGLVTDDKLINGSIDQYPADASHDPVTKDNLNLNFTDNTSDGVISAKIVVCGSNGIKYFIEAEPAWLVVAPPKTNVFFTPAEAEKIKNTGRNFFPLENTNYNLDFIKETSKLLNIKSALDYKDCDCYRCKKSNIKAKINENKTKDVLKHYPLKSKFFCKNNPNHLDYFMMSTINGDYDPGMEICLSGDPDRNEDNFDIQHAFMKPGVRNIQLNEIRVKPFDEQVNKGTKPGQLTSGLCSTWQGDLIACLNFWTAENPLMAYKKPKPSPKSKIEDLRKNKGQIVMHKDGNLDNRFEYAEEIVKHIGKRPLVYHDYDKDGNVYFIKVPNKQE